MHSLERWPVTNDNVSHGPRHAASDVAALWLALFSHRPDAAPVGWYDEGWHHFEVPAFVVSVFF